MNASDVRIYVSRYWSAPAWVVFSYYLSWAYVTGPSSFISETVVVLAAAMPGKIKTVTQMLSIIVCVICILLEQVMLLYRFVLYNLLELWLFQGAGFLFRILK